MAKPNINGQKIYSAHSDWVKGAIICLIIIQVMTMMQQQSAI